MGKLWEIKKTYEKTNLNFCLDGKKGNKNVFFNLLIELQKPTTEPSTTIDRLTEKAKTILDENTKKIEPINTIHFLGITYEEKTLLNKQIVGNTNSSIGELIEKLQNSDWVKQGFDAHIKDLPENEICPFCQQPNITADFRQEIIDFFDENYETDKRNLEKIRNKHFKELNNYSSFSLSKNTITQKYKEEFDMKYLFKLLRIIIKILKQKSKSPVSAKNLKITPKHSKM